MAVSVFVQRQESGMGSRSSLTEGSSKRRGRPNRQSSFIGGSLHNRQGSNFDLTKTLVKNSYFSDINPRNMRRLMNIVGVTGKATCLIVQHKIIFII